MNTSDRELTLLAFSADESLLDLLLEDGLISVPEQKKDASPAYLLALLRRIFASPAQRIRYAPLAARTHKERSDAVLTLRAPPLAA